MAMTGTPVMCGAPRLRLMPLRCPQKRGRRSRLGTTRRRSSGQAAKCGEIVRERLAHALWIVDAHRDAAQRGKRKTHCDAMIVVGVDSRRDEARRRLDR